jgi:hypothetical protein
MDWGSIFYEYQQPTRQSNMDFFCKATTIEEFKQIRKNAQHQYRFLEKNDMKDMKYHKDYKIWLGQITLYAGIANWDKQMWEKGIAKFLKAAEESKRLNHLDEDNAFNILKSVNEPRDKTRSKDNQKEANIMIETQKTVAIKLFEEFVEKKRIYYTEQMPIMYEDYWEGMRLYQEKKDKKKSKKKSKK